MERTRVWRSFTLWRSRDAPRFLVLLMSILCALPAQSPASVTHSRSHHMVSRLSHPGIENANNMAAEIEAAISAAKERRNQQVPSKGPAVLVAKRMSHECCVRGCSNRASFHLSALGDFQSKDNDGWFCTAHRIDGCTLRCGSAVCAYPEGCQVTASFGYQTRSAKIARIETRAAANAGEQQEVLFCATHRQDGQVSPRFSHDAVRRHSHVVLPFVNESAACANTQTGQVNVRRKLCEAEGCGKYANFCDDTTMQRRFCRVHKGGNSTTYQRWQASRALLAADSGSGSIGQSGAPLLPPVTCSRRVWV